MARTDEVIKPGKLVELRYTMRDGSGNYLDGSGRATERYVHGQGEVAPGLERALDGRSAGETLAITLEPEQAFGRRRRSPGPQAIPRATFPVDANLRVGMRFRAESPNGEPVDLYIARIDTRDVFVDTNHPYAGLTLQYEVEIVSVDDPR